jgi:phenylacetate-CoA ligase
VPGWGPSTDLAYRSGPCAILHTSSTTAEQAEWLVRQDPDYLLTTATRALELARLFRRTGLKLNRLREVRTYGEALADDLRAQCRETWDVQVVDMYSSAEVGYMALQCPLHEHYHVQSENVLLEVLDEQGRPCREGETGRVVVSALHNFATPLIRYEVGDYAEAGGACPCGRGLPVLKRILGRVRNMLRMPDGNTRWPNFMLAKVHGDLPLAQIQIVQTALDALELRAVPEQRFSAQDEARLLEYIRDWAGPQFKVSVRIVAAIPRSQSGKFEEFMSLIEGNA